MKIGIITIHNAKNYGAMLQAYALQEIVKEYGETKIIDYNNPYISKSLNFIRLETSVKGIVVAAKDALEIYSRIHSIKKFNFFLNNYLNLTCKKYNNGEAVEKFDIYISGSDQIWNPECISEKKQLDTNYFLSFVPNNSKKIAYASSAGSHKYTGKEKSDIRLLLESYSHIGARESELKNVVKDIVKKDVEHVLDPTLLLSKDDWLRKIKLGEKSLGIEGGYILAYFVNRKNKLYRKTLEKVATLTGLPIISISPGIFADKGALKTLKNIGPIEFVHLFSKASYVVTDSFHGVAFAVNFKIPLTVASPGSSVIRIKSLLKLLGLDRRIINQESEIEDIHAECAYDTPSTLLQKQRTSSLNFIERAICS